MGLGGCVLGQRLPAELQGVREKQCTRMHFRGAGPEHPPVFQTEDQGSKGALLT